MNGAQAFIAFLRCEANQAEERARSLRATATTIEANSSEVGRSPGGGLKKKRKRETKTKRAPTAYTLFVHENYEMIKKTQGDENMPSRDIISLVAQQWAQTSETEKQMWQFRAEQMKNASSANTALTHQVEDEIPELPSPDHASNNDGGGKRKARKLPRSTMAATEAEMQVSV